MRSDIGEGFGPGHRLSYTTDELHDATGIKKRTIELYCKSGKIKAKKIGRNWIIPLVSVRELLDIGEQVTNG